MLLNVLVRDYNHLKSNLPQHKEGSVPSKIKAKEPPIRDLFDSPLFFKTIEYLKP